MEFQEFSQLLEPRLGYRIYNTNAAGEIILNEQGKIITHTNGPLHIIAGPGSGKTETLVLRTLYLLFVRNVDPKSIIVTTFTEKAAKNIKERIITGAEYFFEHHPKLQESIDIYNLRICTLHSLCNDVMQEYHSPDYQNFRLMDDFEQFLFTFEHSNLVQEDDHYLPVYEQFDYLFEKYDPVSGYRGWNNHQYPPNKWALTRAAINLFNRITEYRINLNLMRESGDSWRLLVEGFEQYQEQLTHFQRCDFSTLQSKFLEFLNTPHGRLFVDGDPENYEMYPRLEYLMVDEYQDTNPIQELIYFSLSRNAPHNICIVGDDDQALYRFRGGTVECIVNFSQRCQQQWSVECTSRYLNTNYRSHEKIVEYCNEYLLSFPQMNMPGARIQNKPRLVFGSQVHGNYPSVTCIRTNTKSDTARQFASMVKWLHDNNKIQDYSQCVLLMKSVRETSRHALQFVNELKNQGITPYNPRSRQFLVQEEIAVALGAFISIIDPDLEGIRYMRGGTAVKNNIGRNVQQWIQEYQRIAPNSAELSMYVNEATRRIRQKQPQEKLKLSMAELFYLIISRQPFSNWKEDPERTYRLGKLSSLFEQFSAIPYFDQNRRSNRGEIWASSRGGYASHKWLMDFYKLFVTRLMAYGENDPEDDEIIAPPNHLPIMTVHQAKGLEFDFVFIWGLSQQEDDEDESIHIECDYAPFCQNQIQNNIACHDKSAQDKIRFYFVAYSRARCALIHLLTQQELRISRTGDNQTGFGIIGRDPNRFRQIVHFI
ncbi:UvrD-helicase domain-containing protein [Methanoregula sp.]|uniref:UvrD-helicase domain-containing protein n=1 Tax=Methanoregula sp. TaxID=2052170 RepID=UPI00356AAEE2